MPTWATMWITSPSLGSHEALCTHSPPSLQGLSAYKGDLLITKGHVLKPSMVWDVFSQGTSTITPPQLGGVVLTADQWGDHVRDTLQDFIWNNTPYGHAPNAAQAWVWFAVGNHIPERAPTPSSHLGLQGRCLIFCKHHSNLPEWAQFCPRGPRGFSEGYIWIKPNTFHTPNGPIPPHDGIYLHALLCWMYNGPPDPPNAYPTHQECAHLCEHKQCTIPWHLAFTTPSINKQRAWNKAKRRRVLPNPPL